MKTRNSATRIWNAYYASPDEKQFNRPSPSTSYYTDNWFVFFINLQSKLNYILSYSIIIKLYKLQFYWNKFNIYKIYISQTLITYGFDF